MNKILIADDFQIIRSGMESIIETIENCEVCYLAIDGDDAIDGIINHKPDLAILDISMPKKSGIEVLEFIKKNDLYKNTKILINSIHNEHKTISYCKQIGAEGYIFKDAPEEEIILAVKTLLNNQSYYSESANRLGILSQNLYDYKLEDSRKLGLIDSENTILKLIVSGKTQDEICFNLKLSEATYLTNIETIMKKLNAKNIADLVRIALTQNLI